MYIQITTRCNMRCKHCCYACTSKGIDMDIHTFKRTIHVISTLPVCDNDIAIGGGEPTVHPQFWEFLGLALSIIPDPLWMATNGKRTDDALALADLAKTGAVEVDLSLDKYHAPIDPKVVKVFKEYYTGPGGKVIDPRDKRRIREVNRLSNAGRCTWGDDECPCEDLFVTPTGQVMGCGCEDAIIIGSIHDRNIVKKIDKQVEKNGYQVCSLNRT
jgi:hypothetical protein